MGLGVDDLRWMTPVRPGDVLHVEGEVVELIPSRTKPQGIAKVKWTTYNLLAALGCETLDRLGLARAKGEKMKAQAVERATLPTCHVSSPADPSRWRPWLA